MDGDNVWLMVWSSQGRKPHRFYQTGPCLLGELEDDDAQQAPPAISIMAISRSPSGGAAVGNCCPQAAVWCRKPTPSSTSQRPFAEAMRLANRHAQRPMTPFEWRPLKIGQEREDADFEPLKLISADPPLDDDATDGRLTVDDPFAHPEPPGRFYPRWFYQNNDARDPRTKPPSRPGSPA